MNLVPAQYHSSSTDPRKSTLKALSSRNSSNTSDNIVHLKFKYREFDAQKLPRAMNHYIYGMMANLYEKDQSSKYIPLGPHLIAGDPDNMQLVFLNHTKLQKEPLILSIFDILNINHYFLPIPPQFAKAKLDSLLLFTLKVGLSTTEYILECESSIVRDSLQQALQHVLIVKTYELQFKKPLSDQKLFLEHQVQSLLALQKKTGDLTPQDVQFIVASLEYNLTLESIAEAIFKDKATISVTELIEALPLLLRRQEIRPIFDKYCRQSLQVTDSAQGCMTMEELRNFLIQEQKIKNEVGLSATIEIIIEDYKLDQQDNMMSFQQFSEYLTNYTNTIENQNFFCPMDLDRPLNEYFVSCSRQSLLFENHSSRYHCMRKYQELPYYQKSLIFALERGARLLEIIIWDGPDGLPICFSGSMQNQTVSIEDVFSTIVTYGFQISPLPIIVKVEDHCSKPQKELMINSIKETLGDRFFSVDQHTKQLKSPQFLMGKVILCSTVCQRYYDFLEDQLAEQLEEERWYSKLKRNNFNLMKFNNKLFQSIRVKRDLDYKAVSKTEGDKSDIEAVPSLLQPESQRQTSRPQDMNFYLCEIIQAEMHFNVSPNTVYQIQDWVEISRTPAPISQESNRGPGQSIFAHQKQQATSDQYKNLNKLLEQTQNGKLFRYIPNCKQTDCRNAYVSQGFLCQFSFIMVHHHLIDYNYMYHHAMFKLAGGVQNGYLLKSKVFEIQKQPSQNVKLRIISGSQLMRKKKNQDIEAFPFVQVILREPSYGEEDAVQQFCSNVVRGNTFNPIFNLQCQFTVTDPNLAVLIVCVYNRSMKNLVCWNSLLLRSLRPGYRVMPLVDEYLNHTQSSLFCQLSID